MVVAKALLFSNQSTWTPLHPPRPHGCSQVALCDVSSVRATIGWRNFLLTNQTDSCGSPLSCDGIYRDARRLGGGHRCYNMADLIKEVKEEETEIEIDAFNLQQQASSANERKRKNTDQSDGLDSQKIRKPTRKVKSTLQRNPGRKKKGKRSANPVFYHHPQNKKKNESGPMADEETPEDSSNTSDDSASKPLCPPGAQDAEPSAVTPGKAKAE
ncbi:uncharacterized protein [Bos taurus]|uniref:uncharacterized protein n=1 Tax=Bos taurus TaxID=9913 RepID=UPI0028CB6465|nr:uncharacterized protein LOC786942 [Bos taurus]